MNNSILPCMKIDTTYNDVDIDDLHLTLSRLGVYTKCRVQWILDCMAYRSCVRGSAVSNLKGTIQMWPVDLFFSIY